MNATKKKRAILPAYFTDGQSEMHQAIIDGIDADGKINQHLSTKEKEVIASVLAIYYICSLCRGYHRKALLKTLADKEVSKKKWEEKKEKITKHLMRLDMSLRLELDNMSPEESVFWIDLWEPLVKKIDRYFSPRASNLAGYAIGVARNDETLMSYCMEQLAMRYTESEQSFAEMIGEIRALTAYMKSSITINRTTTAVEKDLQNVSHYFIDA